MLSCRTRYSDDCAGQSQKRARDFLTGPSGGWFQESATWHGSWSKPAVYVIPVMSQIFPEADTALLAVSS